MFSGIKLKLQLLAILPIVTVTIAFFVVTVDKQLNDIDEALSIKGRSTAKHLASASEYGVFSDNISLLAPLLNSTLQDQEILSITITNEVGDKLISLPDTISPHVAEQQDVLTFNSPITQKIIRISDFEERDPGIPEIIGWAIVNMQTRQAEIRKKETLINTLFAAIIILSISGFIASIVSNRISSPITRLTKSVQEIESGNLNVEIEPQSSGEILALEHGISSMAKSLKISHEELEDRIAQTTAELRDSLQLVEAQNKELKEARKEALAASHAKSIFLANISHEIRTPMNGVLGFIRLINKTNPTKEQQDYLNTIEHSAKNLLNLINDILDISRIEAGKISIHATKFNLRNSIDDALTLMAPSVYEKDLEIAHFFYDDTPELMIAAEDRIRQILVNLIGNAIKFSTQGTIVVRTMLESVEENHPLIKISVTDQGIGISSEDQEKLFKSFSQLDSSKERRYEGAGLGLAISKSLTEAMHGNIGVDSKPGQGSTFWFTFTAHSIKEPDQILGDTLFHGTTACIYDSNEFSRLTLAHELKRIGLKTQEFSSLPDLINYLVNNKQCRFCCLGLSKQEMQSDRATAIVANISSHATVKILLFLSTTDPETFQRLRKLNVHACLPKPIRHSDIIDAFGGSVSFDNNPQKLSPEKPDHEETQITRHQPGKILTGIRVLLAEDNPINTKLVNTVLQQEGAIVINAATGQEAVDHYKQQDFDLVLMDIHMPEMNGIEALHIFRNKLAHKGYLPVLALTANTLIDEQNNLYAEGFDDVLIKPVSVELLLHKIKYWLQQQNRPYQQMINTQKISHDQPANPSSLGLSQDLATSLQGMLIQELPDFREQIVEHFNNKNWLALREVIHKLLGGLCYCDAPVLRETVNTFHNNIKNSPDKSQASLHAMLHEIDALLKNQG